MVISKKNLYGYPFRIYDKFRSKGHVQILEYYMLETISLSFVQETKLSNEEIWLSTKQFWLHSIFETWEGKIIALIVYFDNISIVQVKIIWIL